MAQAFVIMQIGNPDLDRIYAEAITHAIAACGLVPRRIDRHNEGGLLKSEIVGFLQDSQIIVADLTNERPNCYLEVGYAMGLEKFRNLILTAREDHNPDSPNHRHGGPKIHFDLTGYDILFWDPGRVADFRAELERRIRRRLSILTPTDAAIESLPEWFEQHKKVALAGLARAGLRGFMEVQFALLSNRPYKAQRELYEAAERAEIHTFGWPIGVVMRNDDDKPHPRGDGIVAEIVSGREHYDYWTLKRNGDFYLLKSLFEDQARPPGSIFFNTRIVRITEVFLYCRRLYANLRVPDSTGVSITMTHGGLRGRRLRAAGRERELDEEPTTAEDTTTVNVRAPLGSIEPQIVELVKQITRPLFELFDFFELTDPVYEDIVRSFLHGRVT
jgi:hypothetical protein